MQIRAVGSQKRYITPATILEDGKPKSVLVKLLHKVPPRSYIVAFSQQGMGPTYQHFCNKLRESLDEGEGSFVHGVCVLDKDWFAGRVAHRKPTVLHGREGNGLLSLYASILKGQQNFAVHAMDLDAYLPQDWG
jgi:hypothetical protein